MKMFRNVLFVTVAGLSVFGMNATKKNPYLWENMGWEQRTACHNSPTHKEMMAIKAAEWERNAIRKMQKAHGAPVDTTEVTQTATENTTGPVGSEAPAVQDASVVEKQATWKEWALAKKDALVKSAKDKYKNAKDAVKPHAKTVKEYTYDQVVSHPYAALVGVATGAAYEAGLFGKTARGVKNTAQKVYRSIAKNKTKYATFTGSIAASLVGAALVVNYFEPKVVEDVIVSMGSALSGFKGSVLDATATKEAIVNNVVSPVAVYTAAAATTIGASRFGQWVCPKVVKKVKTMRGMSV